jgi:predicted nucleic acid binding AN1-type Zn finger protein
MLYGKGYTRSVSFIVAWRYFIPFRCAYVGKLFSPTVFRTSVRNLAYIIGFRASSKRVHMRTAAVVSRPASKRETIWSRRKVRDRETDARA